MVLEEVAKMAYRTELIHPQVAPAPQELQDKHYFRKHGAKCILRTELTGYREGIKQMKMKTAPMG